MAVTRRSVLLRGPPLLAGILAGRLSPAGAAGSPATAAAAPAPVRLIANENPYGPAESARQAIRQVLAESWQYPMAQAQALKRLIAEREGLSPQHVMIGDGSGEILRTAALAYGHAGGEIIAARPTFTFLQDYARRFGCTIREVPLDQSFRHDLGAMSAAIRAATRLVYVCNPNNPTGTLVPGSVLRGFLQDVSRKVPVLVDEAYLDLWDDLPAHTAVDRVRAGDPVIVTRTFSKLHGLAGLRIGYAFARPDIIARLEQHRMSMLNLPGIVAATASYQDLAFQAESRARLNESLAVVRTALASLRLPHVGEMRGNFVFFDTRGPLAEFSVAMRREGFLLGRSFAPYSTWCRVSMGTTGQMRAFACALERHYHGLTG